MARKINQLIPKGSHYLWLFIIGCTILFNSCKKINPCGVFAFTGTAFTGASNGINMNLHFNFDPSACGSNCNATKICYIQMVRTYNLNEGTYSYISEEHQARGTEYGWYVDRLTGRNWGYYGRNNDGSFASNLTPGTNNTDAILFDGPSRPSSMHRIWWQAVSASVSIDGGANSCNNNFLGYYFWSWIVDENGATSNDLILQLVAWENLQNIMDDAVNAWNTQAPGIGHTVFPTFNKLMY